MFHIAVRAPDALRADVFPLAVGARAAHRAVTFLLAMRTSVHAMAHHVNQVRETPRAGSHVIANRAAGCDEATRNQV